MPTPVTMPQLGESVTEGTVTRWLKQVGERVEMDEPLLEVSTDKVDTEIPSPVAGVLVSIDAADDAIIEVGGLLGAVATPDEAAGGPAAQPSAPDAAAPQAAPPMPPPSFPPPAAAATAAPASEAPAPAMSMPEPPDVPIQPTSPSEATGTEIRLPELGESVTEGTITRWLKREGDEVTIDEPLVEISTDKVDTEIPSPTAGTLVRIAAAEDDVVEVGGLLAVVGSGAAGPAEPPAASQPAPEPPPVPSPTPEPVVAPPQSQPVVPDAPATRPTQVAAATAYVTPLVRKLASQSGIDLASVTGTGVGGRIRRQDVEAAVRAQESTGTAAPGAPPATTPATTTPAAADSQLRGTTAPMTRLRRVIADRMVESLHTSAQLTTVVEADVTAIARLRSRVKDRFQQREGVKLSFLPFFALAVVEALKVHPMLNASIDPDTGDVTYHDREALGVAVDTERGLLVPVIQDAGGLNLAGLARRIADLAERTRTNKVTPDELAGGTFTLTNTGSRGALFDTPIINQPQVGILGTGAVVKRPVVVPGPDGSDMIGVHSMVYLALTYDHRIVDGADAARFLGSVKHRLEEGAFEGELGL